ncbi:MAG: hypothetical protein PHU75_09910 [Candidatus Nanopelagicales bacterium]|nr:hypothetical protein [Candidatus Nanopelagicales bacterium]
MSDASKQIPSVRGRLLASLLSWSTLVQPEVALTRATRFLLSLPDGHTALDDLIRREGLHPEPDGYWLTEVRGEEGGRTDLEYRWGSPAHTRVIVEAKIGHTLDAEQVAAYRARLGDDGLLVVLVPASRRREGEKVVEELRREYAAADDPVRVALWTWDQVVEALEEALPEEPDVAQLRGLVDEAGALDIRPFDESELSTANESRFDDLWSVLDRASFGLLDDTARRKAMGSSEGGATSMSAISTPTSRWASDGSRAPSPSRGCGSESRTPRAWHGPLRRLSRSTDPMPYETAGDCQSHWH